MSDPINIPSIPPSSVAHDSNPRVESVQALDDETLTLAMTIAHAIDDRKGGDIAILKVSDISYLADYFVIATGFSRTQVRAIARSVEDQVEEKLQRYPLRLEGHSDGSWILIDYGDVIAHVFLPDEREFYGLEAFWGHAERVSWVAPSPPLP